MKEVEGTISTLSYNWVPRSGGKKKKRDGQEPQEGELEGLCEQTLGTMCTKGPTEGRIPNCTKQVRICGWYCLDRVGWTKILVGSRANY